MSDQTPAPGSSSWAHDSAHKDGHDGVNTHSNGASNGVASNGANLGLMMASENAARPLGVVYPAPWVAGNASGAPQSGGGTDFRQVLAMLHRRRKIILGTLLTVLVTTLLLLSRTPRIYQSTATLQVDTSSRNGGSGDGSPFDELAGTGQMQSMDTQLEILRSGPVQEEAFKKLSPDARQALSKYVDLQIQQRENTDLILVTASAYEPKAARQLASAVTAAYLKLSQEKNQSKLNTATNFAARELANAQKKLTAARNNQEAFKKQTGIISLEGHSSSVLARREAIEEAWRQARTEKAADLAQVEELRRQASSLAPTIVTPNAIVRSQTSETIKQRLTQLELERLTKQQVYQPGSDEIVQLNDEINALRSRLRTAAQTEISSWTKSPNPIRETALAKIADLNGQIWSLEARGVALKAASKQVQAQLSQLPGQEKQLSQITTDLSTLEKNYQNLNEKYQNLKMSKGARVANASVMFPASEAGAVGQSRLKNLILAAILGLGLAAALAALVDWLDDRVYSEEDARDISRLPILAQIPLMKEDEEKRLMINPTAGSPMLENFRMLRTIVAYSPSEKPVRSVTMLSSLPNEGKSVCCINLAVAAALSGERVILVDCDLRRPSLHQIWNLSNERGFTDVVSGQSSLHDALQETSIPGLRVLTSGSASSNPFTVLNSMAARACMEQLKELADFVVIDSPPALVFADAQVISTMTDTSLLVVSGQEAGKREIARTRALLGQTGTRPLGVILNKASGSDGYYQGKYSDAYLHPARNGSALMPTNPN